MALFFTVMQAKTNVQSQLVKLFQVQTARYVHEKNYGVKRHVKQRNRAPRYHLRSQVLKMENRECGEKRQRKKYNVSSEKECDI